MNENLYRLLPLIYRELDFNQRQPLRALMAVLESAHDKVDESIMRLYQDWFIETCDRQRIPLIADLVNLNHLSVEQTLETERRYVANYIAYNRRCGTEQVLNNAIQDVSDISCYTVNSARKTLGCWTDRDPLMQGRTWSGSGLSGAQSDTPFSPASRFASFTSNDTQLVWSQRGVLHPNQVSLFLWRHQSVTTRLAQLTPAANHQNAFYLSPFARPIRLCHQPESRALLDQEACQTDYPYELNANNMSWLQNEAKNTSGNSGNPPVRFFECDPQSGAISEIAPAKIAVADLQDWQTTDEKHAEVLIDPRLSRVLLTQNKSTQHNSTQHKWQDRLLVTYSSNHHRGFGAAATWRNANQNMQPDHRINSVHNAGAELLKWLAQPLKKEPLKKATQLALGVNMHFQPDETVKLDLNGQSLTLWAEDYCCPVLVAHLEVSNSAAQEASLTLNGVFFKGKITLGTGVNLALKHCTLDNPIAPVIELTSSKQTSVVQQTSEPQQSLVPRQSLSTVALVSLSHCLVNSKNLSGAARFDIEDSALSLSEGCQLRSLNLRRSTLLGDVSTEGVTLVKDSLIKGKLHINNASDSEVLYSWVCQIQPVPGLTMEQVLTDDTVGRMAVQFTSQRYFDADFAQLSYGTEPQILDGASNGEEMGVMNRHRMRLKEQNLTKQLTKFLPMGLETQTYFMD